jgi:hypothetical protein
MWPHQLSANVEFDLIKWWISHSKEYPRLTRFALDMASIPAMTVECERTFSSARRLITDDRNNLKPGTVEANECLRAWYKKHMFN